MYSLRRFCSTGVYGGGLRCQQRSQRAACADAQRSKERHPRRRTRSLTWLRMGGGWYVKSGVTLHDALFVQIADSWFLQQNIRDGQGKRKRNTPAGYPPQLNSPLHQSCVSTLNKESRKVRHRSLFIGLLFVKGTSSHAKHRVL